MSRIRLLASSLIPAAMLSACAVASGMTEQEAAVRDQAEVSRFMPATREMRDSIETQELFAQAAFWSHEYELNPSDLEAAIKLAASVRKLGNPSRAVEITQTTRALHPRDPYLLAEHAAGLIADERALDSIAVLDEGLRLAPSYARLWSLKGAALDQMENYQAARQHYARALQITPNDPNVLANVGLSHALSGDPATAEGWLRRAAAQPSASAGVRQNLALVLQLQGKTEEAEAQARIGRLSRGERQLPPPPVPALTPRTTNGQAAQPMRGSQSQHMPSAKLSTQTRQGQPFTTASEAARAASAQSRAQTRTGEPFASGRMTNAQKDVLAQISQSLRPGAATPPSAQVAQSQSASANQPYLVGPAVPYSVPQGYPSTASSQTAADTTRRAPARRRR